EVPHRRERLQSMFGRHRAELLGDETKEQAVQEVVEAFLPDPGVSFAIIQFSGATSVLTQGPDGQDGFTRDRNEIESAIVRLGIAEQPTDYEGALANINRVLTRDMTEADPDALARSRYVVVFLSDGLPNPVRPPTNTRSSILRRVQEIADLQRVFRPSEIRLHTALVLGAIRAGFRCTDTGLEGGSDRCAQYPTAATCVADNRCTWIGIQSEAESLLEVMAEVGNGTFRSFPNGEEINFLRIDFTSIRRVFTLSNLTATNLSARPRLVFPGDDRQATGRGDPDSDGDGLSDAEELDIGTVVTATDTDEDGFGDFLEVRLSSSGFDPLDPTDADCTEGLDRVDTDGDGLLDCEERFAGTNRLRVDTDGDRFPDLLELQGGTNPVVDDTLVDLDFDAARNGAELRGHSDPNDEDADIRSQLSYRYEIIERGPSDLAPNDPRQADLAQGRACYDVRVENITLAPTVDGRNRILLWLAETPFDDPEALGIFRVGCIEQVFLPPDLRNPPFPEVFLPEEEEVGGQIIPRLVSPRVFDPNIHCTTGRPPEPIDESCLGPLEDLPDECFQE
ncbi:MAG: VWA domain-containing protein, partial [Myxococcota bacterium]